MLEENKESHALNEILKGEHMAIHAYEKLIKKIRNKDLFKQLNVILQDHKSHALILNTRVKELGLKPHNPTNISGTMLDGIFSIKSFIYSDDLDIIKELYNGEDKGIAAALKIAEDNLADYDKQLIEEMMSEDYQHLKLLGKLLDNYKSGYLH